MQFHANLALTVSQHPQAAHLRSTLSESLPFCCGTIHVPPPGSILFYGKEGRVANRVDLLNASPTELANLENICDSSTFGVDQKAVLDVAYRNAGSLTKEHFAINLDVERLGLLDSIRTNLSSREDERPIYAELYKLNVYGKGSFFKAHKDTPRGTTTFGSLVLIFPTAHEGGALLFRHDGHEWTFDAARTLSQAPPLPDAPPCVAFVAFFSDVEHEVQRVTAGHRVTLTYTLSFTAPPPGESSVHPAAPSQPAVIHPQSASASAVQIPLDALLSDGAFLPEGGTMGFGLRHLYPLATGPADENALSELEGRLKGADAALLHALTALGLTPELYTVFEDDDSFPVAGAEEEPDEPPRALVACRRVVELETHDLDEHTPLWQRVCRNMDGVLVNCPAVLLDSLARADERAWFAGRNKTVAWVSPLSDRASVKTQFAAYGNEPMMGYLYQRVCMLVAVGPAGDRSRA
ncbi:hypothetical protein C8Q80DRAFT_323511 [Daedaleopsis nitida]|nr:hypothetical protein C8Q80DRAFT_323511 [Daedaleopsis nitida]